MPNTKLSICQAALTRIGAAPIASFAEGTAEGLVTEANYDIVKQNVLSMFPWKCALDTRLVNQLTAVPLPPWLAAWQHPADALKVFDVRDYVSGEAVEWTQQGDKILTASADQVIADFTFDTPEPKLEPHVVELIVNRLAVVFATGVADRASMAGELREELLAHLRMARNIDSQGETPQRVKTGRWRSAR